LKPGMTANVSIVVAHRDNALVIPNGTLRFRPPEGAVVDTNSLAAPTATNSGGVVGGPGSHHGGRPRGEHPSVHTIYVLAVGSDDPKLQAVQVRTGISDGISTEVVSGLEEGAKVVTSAVGPAPTTPSGPFGGGFRMR